MENPPKKSTEAPSTSLNSSPNTTHFSFKDFLKKKDPNDKSIDRILSISDNEEELWDSVGLHKPLGGSFFRNFTYMLLGAIISVIMFTFVLDQLMPWPIAQGYYDISHSIFALVWLIFDVGTAYGIERFIGEWYIKDKRKMMEYVSFYIWYQAITGLIQITAVSWWILTEAARGYQIAHLTWLLLIINAKQWPGMLGTFNELLKSMQHYNNSIVVDFVSSQGFEMITRIVFIIGGRYWGAMHPQIGELMGLSIGMVLGFYIDDFFSMGLAIHYFNKSMRKFGISAANAWIPYFTWPVVKECLYFGIGSTWAPIIGVSIGLIKLNMSLYMIPGYANWIALAKLGAGIAGSINMGGDVDLRAVTAESINNNKFHLTSYYLSQAWKYWAFIMFAMGGIVIVLLPILNTVVNILPGVADQYQSALIFVVPGIATMIWDVPRKHLERILTSASKVWLKSGMGFVNDLINLGLWILYIYVWRVWEWGTIGIFLLFVWADLPTKILTVIVFGTYVHKRIVKIRINWWDTLVAPVFTFFIVFLVGYGFVYGIFLPLLDFNMILMGKEVGLILTGVFGVVVILLGFMLIIFPLVYALAGGWDEFGLETLRKSYLLSGPSKPFIILIYKLSVFGSKISPFYNRFKLDYTKAFEEAQELIQLKKEDEIRLKKINQPSSQTP